MKKQIPTVTIGIPAYNEGKNIINLLKSILRQKSESYVLNKIIVLSDGSTDDIEAKVLEFSKSNPIITLICDKKRIGKNNRLMQLYKINTSDIVIHFDGDVILSDEYVVENLTRTLKEKKAVAVSGNMLPIVAKTFFEKLINIWFMIWYQIRNNVNNGNNIHNSLSSIAAVEKIFAKSINIPTDIYSFGQITYCLVKQRNFRFIFESKALIYFRLPTNIHDYIMQNSRAVSERARLIFYYGQWVQDLYKIPNNVKAKALLKSFLNQPFYTVITACLFLFLPLVSNSKKKEERMGIWKPIESTKTGLGQINI